jgi:hypothetical protein
MNSFFEVVLWGAPAVLLSWGLLLALACGLVFRDTQQGGGTLLATRKLVLRLLIPRSGVSRLNTHSTARQSWCRLPGEGKPWKPEASHCGLRGVGGAR